MAKKNIVEKEIPEVVEAPAVEETVSEPVVPIMAGIVGCDKLNLRKTASTEAQVVIILDSNSVIEVLADKGEWTKVKVNGKTGFVMSKYIETK